MFALAARSVHELQPVDAAALVDCSALNLSSVSLRYRQNNSIAYPSISQFRLYAATVTAREVM
jgi:hypothetical protein